MNNIAKAGIVAAIVIVVAVVTVTMVTYFLSAARTANVQLVDHRADYTGPIWDRHTIISGRVVNSGDGESQPVTIGIAITDPSGNFLHTGTTSPQPSMLSPGQEAPFTYDITTGEMGGYDGQFYYNLSIQSQ